VTRARDTDPERTNREFWDADADDYQTAHAAQLDTPELTWGVWAIPDRELGMLGDVQGLDVLELGCGAAQCSRHVAGLGARRVVALDQSRSQLRHAARAVTATARERGNAIGLTCASATATPFAAGSFDVVFCDHGAMSFCDPYLTVPEVARVLRPGGRLVFSISTLLRMVCFPEGDPDAPIKRRLQSPWFRTRRFFDWGDGTLDYQMPHGEWIRLFADNGMVVDDLREVRAPKKARTTFTDYVDHDWARRWPAEEIWRVRKP
jgi:SAM-dependent methyltransferase